MKKVCGIEISGNTATVVLVYGVQRDYSIVQSDFKKITLSDESNQSVIKSFLETINNYILQNSVEKICVKKVSTSGKYSASPSAYKIEAILQLASVPVKLIHATSLASTIKKMPISDEIYGKVHKYQHKALEVALCGLE